MSNAIAAVVVQAGQTIIDNKLAARSLSVGGDTPTALKIGVGEDPRAVLAWAQFLRAGTVQVDRRKDDVLLVVEGVAHVGPDARWEVTGSFKKQEGSSARSRFPGITVKWDLRPIGGTPSSRGTITVAQLEVLIGALGV